MKCSICHGEIEPHRLPNGEVYWTEGHNAAPINNGQCCDTCNTTVVLPRRYNDSICHAESLADAKRDQELEQ